MPQLGVEKYREMGISAMKFCLENLQQLDKQSFFHTFKAGVAKYPAFLDDYAWLVRALIALQEVTGDSGMAGDSTGGDGICHREFFR